MKKAPPAGTGGAKNSDKCIEQACTNAKFSAPSTPRYFAPELAFRCRPIEDRTPAHNAASSGILG